MRRTLERVRRQLADSVVVQQQRAQRVIPVKCSLTHFRDVIKSKISEKKFMNLMRTQIGRNKDLFAKSKTNHILC